MSNKIILSFLILLAPATGWSKSANSQHPAAAGCFEVLAGEFEDGASYYMAVGEKILEPLYHNPDNVALGRFLEDALVVAGHMGLTEEICESLNKAAF